ncbi:MAG: LysR family transcriptional regulator [Halioglobus sp.]|nr:LysR family transcriptional regulator [Halioglobus sp.]
MVLAKLDFNLLKVLDALLKDRSVSKAADRLSLSQPTVSHALKRLREQLNDPLMVRSSRGMDPTPYAESLIDPLSKILTIIEQDILRQDLFDPKTNKRAFTVGVDTHLANTFIPPLVLSILKEAPGCSVHSLLLSANFQHRPFLEGNIDLAIGTASNNPIRMSREFLFRDEICGIVRKGHPMYKKKISLKELANNFNHIRHYVKGETTTVIDDLLADHQLLRHCPVTISDLQGLNEILLHSDLILVGAVKQVLATIDRFNIELPYDIIKLPSAVTERCSSNVDMFWRPQHTTDPAQQWLREHVRTIGSMIASMSIKA